MPYLITLFWIYPLLTLRTLFSMSRLQRTLIIGLKIFLIGLILHFIIYNFVTYVLHVSGTFMDILWLWKEIFTILFFAAVVFYLFRFKERAILKKDKVLWWLQLIFIALLLVTFIFTFVTGSGISMYVLAFKYDFIGYFIFFTCYHLQRYLPESTTEKISKWYILIIQWMLVLALFRWCAILIKPGILKVL